jgi:predicted transcriptional regulator
MSAAKRTPGAKPPKLKGTVRLSADGVATVLGDLEARLMHVIWSFDGPATAREIHERLIEEHDVHPLTSLTVLNRLVTKRILTRSRRDGPYRYAARLGEDEFRGRASRRVVEGILSLGADAVAASLVDVLAERDPAQLHELARLVRRKLREQDAKDGR